MIEEKLKVDPLKFITYKNLTKYKLGGQVLCKCFDNDHVNKNENNENKLWNIIEKCYPGRFKKWEKKNLNHIWTYKDEKNFELAREATKWLVEEKLRYKLEDIPKNVTHKDFHKYGLESMLSILYNYSYIEALMDTYPNLTRAEFPLTQKLAKLGYEFEAIALPYFKSTKVKIERKCPDIILGKQHLGDLKLTKTGYYNSRSSEYLKYCDKLTIIYLIDNKQSKNTPKLEFKSLESMVALSDNDINKLEILRNKYYQIIKE